jgi:hypothetical protein
MLVLRIENTKTYSLIFYQAKVLKIELLIIKKLKRQLLELNLIGLSKVANQRSSTRYVR